MLALLGGATIVVVSRLRVNFRECFGVFHLAASLKIHKIRLSEKAKMYLVFYCSNTEVV